MKNVTFPPLFETALRSRFGEEEWKLFEASHHSPSPVSIRYNPCKSAPTEHHERIPWTHDGFYLPSRPVFTLDPLLHAGTYYVQEASSMFVEQALQQTADLTQPLRVLDLCGAPGGKSTHLLSLLQPESLLVSNEVIRSRANILSENIIKWGCANVVVTNNDPAHFERLPGFFDVVVVDAPCSGEGLFRKDPTATNEWSGDAVELCSRRQQRILEDVWPALKTNGIIIYSTCTYNETENENNLARFAQQHALESVSLKIEKSWGVEEVTQEGITGYRFFPHRVRGEGFFLAVLRKTDEQPSFSIRKSARPAIPRRHLEVLLSWIRNPDDYVFTEFKGDIRLYPKVQQAAIEFIADALHPITVGTKVATPKHDKLIPHQALALSVALNTESFTQVALNKEEALAYLRKDNLLINGYPKGFALVMYNGIPLGWINVLDNRINNMYPATWRVRMEG